MYQQLRQSLSFHFIHQFGHCYSITYCALGDILFWGDQTNLDKVMHWHPKPDHPFSNSLLLTTDYFKDRKQYTCNLVCQFIPSSKVTFLTGSDSNSSCCQSEKWVMDQPFFDCINKHAIKAEKDSSAYTPFFSIIDICIYSKTLSFFFQWCIVYTLHKQA